jgi:hypothetical protein
MPRLNIQPALRCWTKNSSNLVERQLSLAIGCVVIDSVVAPVITVCPLPADPAALIRAPERIGGYVENYLSDGFTRATAFVGRTDGGSRTMTESPDRTHGSLSDLQVRAAAAEEYGGAPISDQELAEVWQVSSGDNHSADARNDAAPTSSEAES